MDTSNWAIHGGSLVVSLLCEGAASHSLYQVFKRGDEPEADPMGQTEELGFSVCVGLN